jgi:hypothetical protein
MRKRTNLARPQFLISKDEINSQLDVPADQTDINNAINTLL